MANFVKIYSFNCKPLCCRRWRAAKAVSNVISMYLNELFVSIVILFGAFLVGLMMYLVVIVFVECFALLHVFCCFLFFF